MIKLFIILLLPLLVFANANIVPYQSVEQSGLKYFVSTPNTEGIKTMGAKIAIDGSVPSLVSQYSYWITSLEDTGVGSVGLNIAPWICDTTMSCDVTSYQNNQFSSYRILAARTAIYRHVQCLNFNGAVIDNNDFSITCYCER